MTYQDFLQSKIKRAEYFGFEIATEDIHTSLFPHQRDIVKWAVKGGRRAIFASFGLGKTRMQCEALSQINAREGGKHLIIAPLGVKQEFQLVDGPALGMKIEYVRTYAEVEACQSPFMITNYERVRNRNLSLNQFTSISLDEANVLCDFGSDTFQTFIEIFQTVNVKYRFVATAVAMRNRFKELIHYAGFLGIMDTGQALTEFFMRNSEKAGDLKLNPHQEQRFWAWLASWAVFIEKPSDLGYSDESYVLPTIEIIYHTVNVDHQNAGADSWGQTRLFRDAALSLKDAAREKRDTIEVRLQKALDIMQQEPPETHWILWHKLEDERHAIQKAIPEAKSVYGTQEIEEREELIMGFANGQYRIFSSKPQIAGSGCNFQRHCNNMLFIGVDYSFNYLIQAIHRIYRFQQQHPVKIHIIFAESEQEIIKVVDRKWKQHNDLLANMRAIIQKYGLSHQAISGEIMRTIGIERQEVRGKNFIAVNNDCVIETQSMPTNSIDMIITSIPFSDHYEYTAKYEDMGHNDGNDGFFGQMDFLTPELLRVLKPGRVAAIHVKDRILYGNVTGLGMPSVDPFSDLTVAHFRKHGFIFIGRITIVTDVVRENNQTYRLGWTENSKDSTKMGCGMSEYVMLFRKLPSDLSNSYADEPVKKDKEKYRRGRWQLDAHGYWRSSGNRLMQADEISVWSVKSIMNWWRKYNASHIYDYAAHTQLSQELEAKGKLPAVFMLFAPVSHDPNVWHDVTRMRTLNGNQSRKNLANHVCPMQFDIVDRLIEEKTNPGETVYDPFGGIMTVPYRAIKLGRKAYACELSETYFKDGIAYCRAVEESLNAPSLFDDLELEEGQYLEPDYVAGELIKTIPSLPSEKEVQFDRLFVDASNGKNGGLQTETVSL